MDKSTLVSHGPGLVAGVSGLFRHAYGLAVSRFELAAMELAEVRNHVIELVAVFAVAAISCVFALAFASALVVALAWDAMGWSILLVMFVLYTALAAGLVLWGRSMLRQGKLAFPETMNELRNDRKALL